MRGISFPWRLFVAAVLGQNNLAREPRARREYYLMSGRRFWTASSFGLALLLGGCSPTIGLYHDVEGGAISKTRQPPPGMDQPYPNLADVPKATKPAPAGQQETIAAQAQNGVSAPSAGALAGLTLPDGAPPLPDVPGLNLPAKPSPVVAVVAPVPVAAAVPPSPPPPPVVIGFAPGKALLPPDDVKKLQFVAFTRGQHFVIAGGFGDGDLPLALSRARRLADALTAYGVPSRAIRLTASAAGSGGFVQLVY
jgi:hypothetical protein